MLAGRVASPALPRSRPPTLTPQQWALVAAPPLILACMAATFRGLAGRFGARTDYLCGFSVYWLGWCFAFPLALLGRDGFRSLFRDVRPRLGRPGWLGLLALVLPPALGGVAAFPKATQQASPRVVLLSAGIAALNAVGEEVLWRGVFLRLFSGPAPARLRLPGRRVRALALCPANRVPKSAAGRCPLPRR